MKNLLLIFALSCSIVYPQDYKVEKDRIIDLFENLKKFGVNENQGNDRVAYSDYEIKARDYISKKLEKIGAKVYTDFAGNLIAHYNPNNSNLKPILFGSHVDAVPNGGHYDGVAGVIHAIEVLQTVHSKNISLKHPLEVIVFSNEEGGLFGSKALVGKINQQTLDVLNSSGYTNAEGVARLGGNVDRIFEVKRNMGDIHAFLEMHIEQGNNLYSSDTDIGIVEGIVGLKWWDVTVKGFTNHAGTTPMNQRKDAMIAASKFVLMVNETVNSYEGSQVGTVGRISAEPGVPNVIPGIVNLSLELRDLSSEKISMIYNKIIENSKIGIASKDASDVYLNNVTINNVDIGLAAYIKKIEYGSPQIKASNIQLANYKHDYISDLRSKIIIDDKIIKNTDCEENIGVCSF